MMADRGLGMSADALLLLGVGIVGVWTARSASRKLAESAQPERVSRFNWAAATLAVAAAGCFCLSLVFVVALLPSTPGRPRPLPLDENASWVFASVSWGFALSAMAKARMGRGD